MNDIASGDAHEEVQCPQQTCVQLLSVTGKPWVRDVGWPATVTDEEAFDHSFGLREDSIPAEDVTIYICPRMTSTIEYSHTNV
jgi:hypothetical protein